VIARSGYSADAERTPTNSVSMKARETRTTPMLPKDVAFLIVNPLLYLFRISLCIMRTTSATKNGRTVKKAAENRL
jgi:hypothetical protein